MSCHAPHLPYARIPTPQITGRPASARVSHLRNACRAASRLLSPTHQMLCHSASKQEREARSQTPVCHLRVERGPGGRGHAAQIPARLTVGPSHASTESYAAVVHVTLQARESRAWSKMDAVSRHDRSEPSLALWASGSQLQPRSHMRAVHPRDKVPSRQDACALVEAKEAHHLRSRSIPAKDAG